MSANSSALGSFNPGWDALLRLDAELLARHASPGGCADLLAACMFLDRAEPRSAARNFSASTRV
jgi:triphosphoribosyl-dephospho-CoA synthetase